MSKNMGNKADLEVLFHALGLETGFSSTKYCRLFKKYTEQSISREELYASISLPKDEFWKQAESEIQHARDLGVSCISLLDENYPKLLYEIEDPPLILFISGEASWNDTMQNEHTFFAIVGSRKITPYGVSVTRTIARELSALGLTIVSGLAYGVDKCAHEGALEAVNERPTFAVLGSGLLEIYPAMHRRLAEEIVQKGGYIITEYGLNRAPRGYLFPRRNRIISGLCFGVLVVEAEEKSGSLITARLALEQGREVFAVPGPIDAPSSRGCNRILSEGASPVLSVSDLIDSLCEKIPGLSRSGSRGKKKDSGGSLVRLVPEVIHESTERSSSILTQKYVSSEKKPLSEDEALLVDTLKRGVGTFDELMDLGIFSDQKLRSLLLSLQMTDIIQEVAGIYVVIE
jgi:DNA processing protein